MSMDDPEKPVFPPQRPVPKKPPVRRGQPASREAQWIGFLILGFGVLAVIAVGILAYNRFAKDNPEREAVSELAKSIESARKQEQKEPQNPAPQKPAYKRQHSLQIKDIEGTWQTSLPDGQAVFQLEGRVYSMIVAFNDPRLNRFYSSGTYDIREDIVILEPRLDWQLPEDGFEYSTLAMSHFPVLISVQRGQMIWQIPPTGEGIYVPPVHPFLRLTQDKTAVWKTLR